MSGSYYNLGAPLGSNQHLTLPNSPSTSTQQTHTHGFPQHIGLPVNPTQTTQPTHSIQPPTNFNQQASPTIDYSASPAPSIPGATVENPTAVPPLPNHGTSQETTSTLNDNPDSRINTLSQPNRHPVEQTQEPTISEKAPIASGAPLAATGGDATSEPKPAVMSDTSSDREVQKPAKGPGGPGGPGGPPAGPYVVVPGPEGKSRFFPEASIANNSKPAMGIAMGVAAAHRAKMNKKGLDPTVSEPLKLQRFSHSCESYQATHDCPLTRSLGPRIRVPPGLRIQGPWLNCYYHHLDRLALHSGVLGLAVEVQRLHQQPQRPDNRPGRINHWTSSHPGAFAIHESRILHFKRERLPDGQRRDQLGPR